MRALALLAFIAALGGAAQAADKLTWREANKQSAAMLKDKKLGSGASFAKQAFDLYADVADGYDPRVHAQLLLNFIDAQRQAKSADAALRELERGANLMTLRNEGEPPPVLAAVYEEGIYLSTDARAADARRIYRRAIEVSDRLFGVSDARSILLMARWAAEWPREHDALAQLAEARRRAIAGGATPALLALLDLGAARLEAANRNWQAAIEAYSALIAGLEARNAPHERTTLQSAHAQLAYVYERMGNRTAAEQIQQNLVRTFGSDGELKPLFRPMPSWPIDDWSVEATVVVEITVGEDGNVIDTKVVDATNFAFVSSAIRATRQWKFAPKIVDGKPVVHAGLQRLDFTMRR